ncbi:hypothetical protein, partial [Candidatus Binatus sp.]
MNLKRKISRMLRGVTFAATILVVASVEALAQNLPPPGAYQPIPNFTGVGAGLQFREAINDRFSGAQPIAPTLVPVTAAQLAAMPAINGGLLYCTNCQGSASCSSGGSGAVAFGMGGDWNCNVANSGGLSSVTNDSNVTGTLSSGGTHLTIGWTGNLPVSRGGSGCPGGPIVFSALPASPVTGTTCTITDAQSCVAGTAIAVGGYTTNCQITWNGANWMPAGGAAGGVSNAVLYAANYSGATFEVQVNACLAALPAGGGTCDARGLTGAQTMAASITVGTAAGQAATLLLPVGTITRSTGAQFIYGSYSTIVGSGSGTVISGADTVATFRPIDAYGGTGNVAQATIEHLHITNSGGTGDVGLEVGGVTGSHNTDVASSNFEDIAIVVGDTGVAVAGPNGCTCYNHFKDIVAQGTNYGVKVVGPGVASNIFGEGGGYGGAVGLYDSGNLSIYIKPDIEGAATHGIELAGSRALILDPYEEGDGSDSFDSTALYNLVIGTGTGAFVDNSTDGYAGSNMFFGTASSPITLGASKLKFGAAPWLDGQGQAVLTDQFSIYYLDLLAYGTSESVYGAFGHYGLHVGELTGFGGVNTQGAVIHSAINFPNGDTGFTITQHGTAGSTSATYGVVCHDWNGGTTLAATASTSTGNSSLNGTNYNVLSWNLNYADGCAVWDILKQVDSTWESIATAQAIPVPAGLYPFPTATISFNDTGQTPQPYTMPTRNSTG